MVQTKTTGLKFPQKLQEKLSRRESENSIRHLGSFGKNGIDFSSNDYLGLSTHPDFQLELEQNVRNLPLGSTGSRLLTGNTQQHQDLENQLAMFFHSEAALLFNSGYQANLALFSAIPQKGDSIFYDQLCHASIRDGIRLSHAKSFGFKHNDLDSLAEKLNRVNGVKYIAVESVYSMDGDLAPLNELVHLAQKYDAFLIVDEAHATGVIGKEGKGLCEDLGLSNEVFARVHTFGKAIASPGATVLGSKQLVEYLINFARPLIYTTALGPREVLQIELALEYMSQIIKQGSIKDNIEHYLQISKKQELGEFLSTQRSAIQHLMVQGNKRCRDLAKKIQADGFSVYPILSPSVQEGSERIRICLHASNTKDEINALLQSIKKHINAG